MAVRRHRFAFVFIAILVAILFLPSLVRREVFTIRDHSDYFQPLRYFTAIHLRSFLLPYWNPYSASGEQWLANPQTGVFYPPTWLFIPLPFETAYMLYLALHVAILGWGAYLLFSTTVSEGAALVGGVAMMFSGPALSLLDVSNNLATFAWVPLVMWSAVARISPLIAAVLLAMAFLGGEPFFAAIAGVLYVVLRLSGSAGAWRAPRFFAEARNDILTAGLGALGLSAIQLLPFLEIVRGSDRAARLSAQEIFRESMPLRDWLRVAVPPRLSSSGFDAALSQHFIPVVYVGVGVVLLAVVAWVAVRRRALVGWTVLLIVAMIVAAGNTLPLGGLVEHIPVTPFRYPSRVVPFGALAIVGLAVLAWDRFRPRRRWADLVLVMVLMADLVPRAAPLLKTGPFSPDRGPYPARVGRAAKFIRLHDKAMVDRSAWMAGYVNLYHRLFDASTAAPLVSQRYLTLHDAALTQGRLDLVAFLGAGFVLMDGPAESPLKAVGRVGDVTLAVSPIATQMATFWPSWQPVATADDAMQALLASGTSGGLPLAGAQPPPDDSRSASAQPIERLSIDTRGARVTVDAPQAGVLMLTQQDARGWRVYVDGREEKKLLAGGIFRAVAIPAGRHEVEWTWHPSLLRVGMAITMLTALSLHAIAFVKRSRRRKFSS